MIIAVNCFATFAIFCGLKLIDIGSTLSEPVRKFSPALGIIFTIVAIANFLLGDTLSLLDSNYVAWTVTVSMVAFAFLCFLISIIKRSLLVPKRKQSQKRGRASKLSVAAIGAIDVVTGCVIGAVSGISFTLNFGTGIMVLCSLLLLQIATKIMTIRRYQEAFISRRENVTVLVLSLCASPIVASLVNAWARVRYRHVGVFMAIAIGFLLFFGIYHLVLIVKKFQNR